MLKFILLAVVISASSCTPFFDRPTEGHGSIALPGMRNVIQDYDLESFTLELEFHEPRGLSILERILDAVYFTRTGEAITINGTRTIDLQVVDGTLPEGVVIDRIPANRELYLKAVIHSEGDSAAGSLVLGGISPRFTVRSFQTTEVPVSLGKLRQVAPGIPEPVQVILPLPMNFPAPQSSVPESWGDALELDNPADRIWYGISSGRTASDTEPADLSLHRTDDFIDLVSSGGVDSTGTLWLAGRDPDFNQRILKSTSLQAPPFELVDTIEFSNSLDIAVDPAEDYLATLQNFDGLVVIDVRGIHNPAAVLQEVDENSVLNPAIDDILADHELNFVQAFTVYAGKLHLVMETYNTVGEGNSTVLARITVDETNPADPEIEVVEIADIGDRWIRDLKIIQGRRFFLYTDNNEPFVGVAELLSDGSWSSLDEDFHYAADSIEQIQFASGLAALGDQVVTVAYLSEEDEYRWVFYRMRIDGRMEYLWSEGTGEVYQAP